MRELIRAGLAFVMNDAYSYSVVTPLRTNHIFRISLIVAMLLGWLALSQRCALGQMLKAKQAAAVQHECCEKNRPQPDRAPVDGRKAGCCQALSVLVPDGVKAPGASITESLPLPVAWIVAAMELRPTGCVSESKADPPPNLLGFTELVLHRSLRSHAPPILG